MTDPLEGTPYRGIRRLGRGATGDVWLAEQRALQKRVAVKILSGVTNEAVVDRFRLEAQALARIAHPNVIEVTDMSRTPAGSPYLVMDLLEGRTLAEELKTRGYFSLEEARQVMLQMLAGLTALHEQGLLHRDIKPSNVFYCAPRKNRDRRIVLIDLGLVKLKPTVVGPGTLTSEGQGPDKVADSLQPLNIPTASGKTLGTPRYMPPEQAMGHELDARADLYAATLVLYDMIAGKGPFHELQGLGEVLMAHVMQPPRPPSRLASQFVPPEVDVLIARMLAKNPDDRLPTAVAFAQALRLLDLNQRPSYGEPPSSRGGTVKMHEVSAGGTVALRPEDLAAYRSAPDDPPPASSPHDIPHSGTVPLTPEALEAIRRAEEETKRGGEQ